MKQIIDGNTAASKAAYLFSEVSCIYPITPSSPMASNMDQMSGKGEKNLFNDTVKVVEMQSEAGAAGAFHGALLSGSLASTFTASQGLLLMIPNMYKIAGEGLPGVIHVAARTIATHALSIFGDHSDIYATRQTGFCMLASTNVEQCYHMAAIAHLSAIKGSIPFLHFFDGFRTSHELNVIEELDKEKLLSLVDKNKLKEFKSRSLNLGDKKQYGMAENEDIYFQSVEARNKDYQRIPKIVEDYMNQMNEMAGTTYQPFNYYGDESAEDIIIAMGSVCDTIKQVVDKENKQGKKLGMIEVHLYRPFSKEYLCKVLPKSVKRIAVLDRTKEAGATGEPLYLDVVASLRENNIKIVGGRYGLSSKNTTPAMIHAVYKMLEESPKENFTIGIKDDLTHLSLEIEDYEIELPTYEMKIYGFGSDGMVSASKDMLHILGEKNEVQGYFEYDSKKSGGVTISHMRLGKNKIHAPYYVTRASLTVVTKDEYFQMFDMLSSCKENGVLLVNTKNEQTLLQKLTKEDIEIIECKKLRVILIDADSIALKHHIPGKISKIMEIIILNLLGEKESMDILSKSISEKFKNKGEEIVKNNINAMKESLESVHKFTLVSTNKENRHLGTGSIALINHRLGSTLSTSELEPYKNGSFEGGLTQYEKRGVSSRVPKWIKENCIQCGMCSMVCPHAVIRPFLLEEEKGLPAMGQEKYHFIISVSERDCTGCGLCINACPGKQGKKALEFGEVEEEKVNEAKKLFESHKNPEVMSKFTIKGSQLEKPKFEFSGACAGCGEAAYIKLLTQLYGDEIVIGNATGCSSIYGGSAPSTPYSLPWANSLFEDNAEFTFGMHLSYKTKRNRIKQIMTKELSQTSEKIKSIYQEYLDNENNHEITKKIYEQLKQEKLPEELKELLEYIPARTTWAIGGDGWAYDIGFGGIDHVLSSEENIKILVLDTEVYSNTGGQMSKSSHIGAVAEFANFGKKSHKKDLFRIAMSYPNCYVASISLGANMMQAIKVFKEAEEHEGPSIVIAYSTCIEHGIKGGMSCSLEEQKLAVDSGYTLLMRYKPEEEKLYLDSKEPNFDLYDEFLDHEVRYHSLKLKDENLAKVLLEDNKETAKNRYHYYKKLSQE